MRRTLFAVFGTVAGLVMLLSFKTQALAPVGAGALAPVGPDDATASVPTTAPATTPSAGTGSTAAASGTYTGDAASTRYGPVQVEITVNGGRVTAAQAVDYPQGNPRDAEINARAIPELNSEAGAAGTAGIDVVSGATYTSEGYIQSLQSALDRAGL